MRCVLQRVKSASVAVDAETVGEIGHGLLALVGVVAEDADRDLEWMTRKLVSLRIFPDAEGKMNRSVVDVAGQVLLVSQFTVCADVGKGTRPSFGPAMAPDDAARMFDRLVDGVRDQVPVETGTFQAHMEVSLVNDGPVTIWLDSQSRGRQSSGRQSSGRQSSGSQSSGRQSSGRQSSGRQSSGRQSSGGQSREKGGAG